MFQFILRRLFVGIPTIFIIITLSFMLMRFSPGSPFTGEKNLSPEVMANIEAKYGFDKPLYQQYFTYLSNLSKGDLGPSFTYKDKTVNELLAAALPVSLKLGFYVFIIALFLGLSMGIIAALNHNRPLDYSMISLSLVGYVIPNLVLGPMFIYFFAVYLRVLPGGGWEGGDWRHMAMPVAVLVLSSLVSKARFTRGTMLETLNANFIRTARAKGLSKRAIVLKHALRPTLVPLLPTLVFSLITIWTGTIVIEKIFSLPGVGYLFINGALNRDYSLSLSLTLLVAVSVVVATILIDILYALIDPRLR